jgi:hypothetical protein
LPTTAGPTCGSDETPVLQDEPAVHPNCTSIKEFVEKLTGRPEVALAAMVNGAVPNTWLGSALKVMVWLVGVTVWVSADEVLVRSFVSLP